MTEFISLIIRIGFGHEQDAKEFTKWLGIRNPSSEYQILVKEFINDSTAKT